MEGGAGGFLSLPEHPGSTKGVPGQLGLCRKDLDSENINILT